MFANKRLLNRAVTLYRIDAVVYCVRKQDYKLHIEGTVPFEYM